MVEFKKMIMKDIGYKILSIVIAIFLWFIVLYVENPIDSRNYSATLQVKNHSLLVENGYIIGNLETIENTEVALNIKAQRNYLDRLSQAKENIVAYIDISDIAQTDFLNKDITATILVELPQISGASFEIYSQNIYNVKLNVEKYVSKEFDVQVVFDSTPTTESIYSISKPVVSPSTVNVYGAEDVVNSINNVVATVKLETDNENIDFFFTSKLVALNENDEVVSNVSFDNEFVDISFGVIESKVVNISVDTSKLNLNDFDIISEDVSQSSIEVVGDAHSLEGFDELKLVMTGNVNASKINQSFSKNAIQSLLPQNIGLNNQNQQDINVTMTFGKVTEKNYTITSDQIYVNRNNIDENLTIIVSENPISFKIRGDENVLNKMVASDIIATIALDDDLVAGTKTVDVSISLPDNVTIVSTQPRTTIMAINNTDSNKENVLDDTNIPVIDADVTNTDKPEIDSPALDTTKTDTDNADVDNADANSNTATSKPEDNSQDLNVELEKEELENTDDFYIDDDDIVLESPVKEEVVETFEQKTVELEEEIL